jgi:hypothetical protein
MTETVLDLSAPAEPALGLTTEQRAADQERLVRGLAELTRRHLAGEDVHDDGDARFFEKFRPSRKLQLGVLPPLPAPDPPEDDEEEGSAGEVGEQREQAAPAAQELRGAPPSMGIDCLIDPAPDGIATLRLHARCSVYIPRYPTVAQQVEHWAVKFDEDGNVVLTDHAGGKPEAAEDGAGKLDGHGKKKQRRQRQREMTLFSLNERIDLDIGPIEVTIPGDRPSGSLDRDDEVQAIIDAALRPVLAEAGTVQRFESGRQTLNPGCVTSQEDFDAEIRRKEGNSRTERPLEPHRASFNVSWRREPDTGRLRVQVTFSNESVAPRRSALHAEHRELDRDMHLFNTQVSVATEAGVFANQPFSQAPEDYRFDDLRRVWGHGRNAVVEGHYPDGGLVAPGADTPPDVLRTTTWPLFRQRRLIPNPDIELSFAELADEQICRGRLADVEALMVQFAAGWRGEIQKPKWQGEGQAAERQACERGLADFEEEMRRYKLGLRAFDEDPRLRRAFFETNRVFGRTNTRRGIRSWRLFQVVYQVIHLAALYARETDEPAFVAELDTADVLFYPTGGGKTESYLGLATVAMFYDRLRGKRRGVTCILRFPLRMLSVQQLVRVGMVIWAAEERRREILDSEKLMDGDPFRLGYYVGNDNTPNGLAGPRSWRDNSIAWWADELKERPELATEECVISQCLNPDCPGGEVRLEADLAEVRLRHVCSACGELPVCHTDDEVFRYLPAMTVCTVDKLAAVGRNENVAHLIAGPTRYCEQHGYFTYLQPRFEKGQFKGLDRCLAGSYCNEDKQTYAEVTDNYDPVPALQVQDEMHLLQETLGTFDAHYETTYEHLQRSTGTGKPTKLLAATATVERYEAQMRNLYARRAAVFPSPGYTREFSFYTRLTHRAARIYAGALPMLRDAAEFGARVQAILHAEVERLQNDPQAAVAELELEHITDPDELATELFLYDLSLGYVNKKRDGDLIQNELRDFDRDYAQPDGTVCDELKTRMLSSDSVTLAEIAETLRRIESEDDATPRPKRLRGLIGTSLVSHGVDITRLNLMVMNWMPPKVADYIQATSRAGREHVGLVIVGHDRAMLRDRSHFHYFLPHHRFLERLVAPVPVNRFARFAAARTMPGIVCACILQGYSRERGAELPIARRGEVQKWLNARTPNELKRELTERALDCLGLKRQLKRSDGAEEPIFDDTLVRSLAAEVELQVENVLEDIKALGADRLIEMIDPSPLISFRDVEPTLGFGAIGRSARAIDALTS